MIQEEISRITNHETGGGDKTRRSILHELSDNETLPAEEKSPSRLEQEGTMLMMAGARALYPRNLKPAS